jgi:hypothetical protein
MAHITIGTSSTRADFTASASQTVFTVAFEFFDEDDLLVYQNNVLLTKTTNYTVTPVTTSDGGFDGGTVTLVSGASLNDKIAIVLSMPFGRSSDFPTAGPFNVTTLNTTLDKNAVRFKQLDEIVSRSITGPTSEGALEELPNATTRASRLMSFDASGNPSTVAADSLSLATLQAFTDYRITNGTGNGSTTTLTLSADPGQEGNTQVYIDGVYQSKGNYSIAGTTLTFSTAPPNGSSIEVVHGQAAGTYVPLANSLTYEQLLQSDIDTDLSSVSGSHDTIASAKAVKDYSDSGTQTLTNKTLTSPIATGNVTLNGATLVTDNNTIINFRDTNTFFAVDNADATKKFRFEGSGIATNTTRVLTVPNATTTLVGTDATQTLTNKTFSDYITFPDSAGVKFGTNDDLQIYHNGNHSYITEGTGGTGNLYILATNLTLGDHGSNHTYLSGTSGGATTLFYDNTQALTTGDNAVTATGHFSSVNAVQGGIAVQAQATHASFNGDAFRAITTRASNSGFNLFNGLTSNGSVQVCRITGDGSAHFNNLTATGDVTFTGANYNALWDKSSSYLQFSDNAKATFGGQDDLQIYHNSSGEYSVIAQTGTGDLWVGADASINFVKANISEYKARFISDGAVELYHDANKKFETTAGGVDITGTVTDDGATHGGDVTFTGDAYNALWDKSDSALEFADNARLKFGEDGDLQIWHNPSGEYSIIAQSGTGDLWIGGDASVNITNAALDEHKARFHTDGGAELYHNAIKKFETTARGIAVTGIVNPTGDTAAGDDAAIGWTAAEGLILTGQGSTGDITLKNDADALVCYVKTGTNELHFPDNAKAIFGDNSDLSIYSGGSSGVITAPTNLRLYTADWGVSNAGASESMINAVQDGAVSLFHNGVKKFETTAGGVNVTGTTTDDGATHDGDVTLTGANYNVLWDKSANYLQFSDNAKATFGGDDDLQIYHNSAGEYSVIAQTGSGDLWVGADASVNFVKANLSEYKARFISDGAAELYYDSIKKFATAANGVVVSANKLTVGDNNATGAGTPAAGDNYDSVLHMLGDSSSGWKMGVDIANTILVFDRESYGWQEGVLSLVRANGNVGIGIKVPDANHDLEVWRNGGVELGLRSADDGASMINFGQHSDRLRGRIYYTSAATEYMSFAANGNAERVRIGGAGGSTGVLFVNTTVVRNVGCISVDYAGNSMSGMGINDTDSGNGSKLISFLSGGTYRGGITNNNNTAVAYNTTSDARLKENSRPIPAAADRIQNLKPSRFEWKSTGHTSEGFLAQEVLASDLHLAADAVTGDPDGDEMLGMDYGKLTPLLTAALQEALTKIDALEARIVTLEGN